MTYHWDEYADAVEVPSVTGILYLDTQILLRRQAYEIECLTHQLMLTRKDLLKVFNYGSDIFSDYEKLKKSTDASTTPVNNLVDASTSMHVLKVDASVDVSTSTVDVSTSTDFTIDVETAVRTTLDQSKTDENTQKVLKNKKFTAVETYDDTYVVTEGNRGTPQTEIVASGPLFYGKNANIANKQLRNERKKNQKKKKQSTGQLSPIKRLFPDVPDKTTKKKVVKLQMTDEEFFAWNDTENAKEKKKIESAKSVKIMTTLMLPRVLMTVETVASFIRKLGIPCFPVGVHIIANNFMCFYAKELLDYHLDMVNLAIWFRHMFKSWVRKDPEAANKHIRDTSHNNIIEYERRSNRTKFAFQYPVSYDVEGSDYYFKDQEYIEEHFYMSEAEVYRNVIDRAIRLVVQRIIYTQEKIDRWEKQRDKFIGEKFEHLGVTGDEMNILVPTGKYGLTAEDNNRINEYYMKHNPEVEPPPEPIVVEGEEIEEDRYVKKLFCKAAYWLQILDNEAHWKVSITQLRQAAGMLNPKQKGDVDITQFKPNNYLATTIIDCDSIFTTRLKKVLEKINTVDINKFFEKSKNDCITPFRAHCDSLLTVSECKFSEVHRETAIFKQLETDAFDSIFFGQMSKLVTTVPEERLVLISASTPVNFRNFVDADGDKIFVDGESLGFPHSDMIRNGASDPFLNWLAVLDKIHDEVGDFSVHIYDKGKWIVCTKVGFDMKAVSTKGDILIVPTGGFGCPLYFSFERSVLGNFLDRDFWSNHDPTEFLYSCLDAKQTKFDSKLNHIDLKNYYCHETNMFRQVYNQFKGMEDYDEVSGGVKGVGYEEVLGDLYPVHGDKHGDVGSTICTLRSAALYGDIYPKFKSITTFSERKEEMTMNARLATADNIEVRYFMIIIRITIKISGFKNGIVSKIPFIVSVKPPEGVKLIWPSSNKSYPA